MPLIIVSVFVVSFPSAIIESQQAAASGYEQTLLGWETWKAELGNGIDDFISWLVTGERGENAQAFRTDVAVANDSEFETFTGTSNVLVAVINNYFRKEYAKSQEDAEEKAAQKAEELYNNAINDGVLPEDIYIEQNPSSNVGDYLDWTLYLISCSSISNMYSDGVQFQVAPIINIAQNLIERNGLWDVGITSSVQYGTTTRLVTKTRVETIRVEPFWETRSREEQLYDSLGNPLLDEHGRPTYTTVYYDEEVFNYEDVIVEYQEEEEFPTRHISIEYYAKAKADGKDYILNQFNLSDSKNFDSDISDKSLVEEQVQQLRTLYSTALGNLTATGRILEWIQSFYENHSDLMFDGPQTLHGPIADWRNHITSHMGESDIPEHASGHNGTDIASPSGTPLVLEYDAIPVAVTNSLPNIRDDSNPRGNLVLLYYGERGGVQIGEQKGIFVLYQHLETAPVNLYEKYSAGTTVATSGTSGQSTGPHWHIECYVGSTKIDAEVFLL